MSQGGICFPGWGTAPYEDPTPLCFAGYPPHKGEGNPAQNSIPCCALTPAEK